MLVIVSDNCAHRDSFKSIARDAQERVLAFTSGMALKSLKYLMIADSDPDKFYEEVYRQASILNVEIFCGDSKMFQAAAKVIEGIDNNGEYSQIIIVKSGMMNLMVADWEYLNGNSNKICLTNYDEFKGSGLAIVLHELGHVIDNELLYLLSGEVNLVNGYNLLNRKEREEYYLQSAIGLWGEFFAEYFVYDVCPQLKGLIKSKKQDLLNCIYEYYGSNITPEDRAYRILYLFAHTIAYQGESEFEYEDLADYGKYVPILKAFEEELFDLRKIYPEIKVRKAFRGIKATYKKMCELIHDELYR